MALVQTVTEQMFCDAFIDANRKDNFSYYSRLALFEWYDNLADEMDENIEFNVINVCMEWTEYTKSELVGDYYHIIDAIEIETEFREDNDIDTTTDHNDDTYEKFFVEPLDEEQQEELDEIIFDSVMEELENETSIIRVNETNTISSDMNFDGVLVQDF